MSSFSICVIFRDIWSSIATNEVRKTEPRLTDLLKNVTEKSLGITARLSVVKKLMEGILSDTIYMHLERHALNRDSQRGKLCLSKLIWGFFLKRLQRLMRAVQWTLHFSKAFDKVPHDRLRWKVRSHVTQGEPAKWYKIGLKAGKSYGRGWFSDWRPVTSVVQFWFTDITYILNLDENVGGIVHKFADDTTIGDTLSGLWRCQWAEEL